MLISSLKSFFASDESPSDHALERRVDPRRKVLIRAEVFPVLGYAEMNVYNVSKTGLAAETDAPIRVGQVLLFCIDTNDFHMGVVRWRRGRRFGLDLEGALAILGLEDDTDLGYRLSHRPRASRHDVDVTGRIALGSKSYRATVRDVSQSGLRLETAAPLAERQQLIISLKDRPLILSHVQWSREGLVGVRTSERMTTLRLVYASD